MLEQFLNEVLNPARLAALRRLGLLDTPAEAVFDKLSDLASELLNTPVALVTLVDDTRQFFKSCRGLPEPWQSWRETPLSHSFCQHVVAGAEPLILTDARKDPRFAQNLAIADLGVVAYLGVPLKLSGGHVLGTFCVIDRKPRTWSDRDIRILDALAYCVMTELELRSEIAHKEVALKNLRVLNEDLKAFSYSVSHDLQAPLRAVVNFGELLDLQCGPDLNDACKDHVQVIRKAGARMSEMIEALLALAHIGKSPAKFESVNLTELARELVAELRALEPSRDVRFEADEDLYTSADVRLIRQFLGNLLSNAWKFSADRKPAVIELRCTREADQPIYSIRDNGVGFASSNADRIFQPFTRLHGSEIPGSGIGLATAKRIIEHHGGKIWAESQPGAGATFYFTIPPKPVVAPAPDQMRPQD